VCIEARYRKADKPDEVSLPGNFHRPKPKAVILEVSIDSIREGIGLSAAEDTREVLHYDRISIQSGKGLSVAISPRSQN
jgi:hypothetical protein